MSFTPYIVEKTPNGEKTWDLFSRLLNSDRTIMCMGPVNTAMATNVIGSLLYLYGENPTADITMYLNSPGGSVSDGLGIVDTMKFIQTKSGNECKIKVVCVGMAASMGSVILSAGTKGQRFCLPNAQVMLHQIRTHGGDGVTIQTDRANDAAYGDMLNNRLAKILAENCGVSIDYMIKLMNFGDRFMFADEGVRLSNDTAIGIMNPITAKELGIIDDVIGV